MHIDAGVVVREARGFGLTVVTVDRMVKTLAHVIGERERAIAADAFGKELGQAFEYLPECQRRPNRGRARQGKRSAAIEVLYCAYSEPLATKSIAQRANRAQRTILERKTRNACAHRGKCNGFETALMGNPQGMSGGVAQGLRARSSPKPHARRVDYEARLQFPRACDGGISDGDAADGGALPLNFFPAFAADGSGDAPAEDQIVVRGVDDGVRIHLRQVALLDDDSFNKRFHRGFTFHACYGAYAFFLAASCCGYSYMPRPALRPRRPS